MKNYSVISQSLQHATQSYGNFSNKNLRIFYAHFELDLHLIFFCIPQTHLFFITELSFFELLLNFNHKFIDQLQ